MKNILLYDTSVGSLNQGDNIIMKSIRENMYEVLNDNFVITMPTHTPCFYPFQENANNKRFFFAQNCDYKFICGTNMINYNMKEKWPNWNTYIWNCREYVNSVLLGVGCTGVSENGKVSNNTEKVLRKILSERYIHSTRDEKTKYVLEKMGYKALNTGCPTTWGLTKEFCNYINTRKRDKVVFTFTDYLADRRYDQLLIDKLQNSYCQIYFWPQGSGDFSYFKTMNNIDGIQVISPDITSYSKVLNLDVDYVGTRLHAGIFAMQHKVRAFIICVDNRANDMAASFGINCIGREELENLEQIVNSEHITAVNIPEEEIAVWKQQFLEGNTFGDIC